MTFYSLEGIYTAHVPVNLDYFPPSRIFIDNNGLNTIEVRISTDPSRVIDNGNDQSPIISTILPTTTREYFMYKVVEAEIAFYNISTNGTRTLIEYHSIPSWNDFRRLEMTCMIGCPSGSVRTSCDFEITTTYEQRPIVDFTFIAFVLLMIIVNCLLIPISVIEERDRKRWERIRNDICRDNSRT